MDYNKFSFSNYYDEDLQKNIHQPISFNEEEVASKIHQAIEDFKKNILEDFTKEHAKEVSEIKAIVSKISDEVHAFNDKHNQEIENYLDSLNFIAVNMFKTFFDLMEAEYAAENIKSLLTKTLASLNVNQVTLTLNPQMHQDMEEIISANDWGLTIKTDPNLSISDYKLDWPEGGMYRIKDEIFKELETIISNAKTQGE